MRHSDPRLTAKRYTDEALLDFATAIESLDFPRACQAQAGTENSEELNLGLVHLLRLAESLTETADPDRDIMRQIATLAGLLAEKQKNTDSGLRNENGHKPDGLWPTRESG